MADYEQTPDVKKRLRYYDNQFLLEQDFIDEQKYHIDRQRWHDRHLHVAGVVAGLDVKKTGTAEVTVEPGTAVDSLGRHILLSKEQPVELAGDSEMRLYLRFHEVESDKALDEGASGATRFCQEPQVFFPKKGDTVAADWVLLAEVKGTGTTIQSVDTSVRQYAGVRLPGPEGKDAGFLRYFADAGSLATLRLGVGNDSRDSLRLYQGGLDRLVIQNGNVDIPNVLRVGSDSFSHSAQVAIKASSTSGDMLSLEKADGYQMLRVDNNGEVSIDRLSVSTMLRMGSGSFSQSAQVAIKASSSSGSMLSLEKENGHQMLRVDNDGEVSIDRLTVPTMLRVGSGSFSQSAQVAIKASSSSGNMLSLEKADGHQMLRVDNNGEVSIDRLTVPTMLRVGSGSFSHSAQVAIKAGSSSGNMLSLEKADGHQMLRVDNNGEVSIDRLSISTSLKVNTYEVARSSEVLRIMRGSIEANGRIIQGSGFNVDSARSSSGVYWISFNVSFKSSPTVVASQSWWGNNQPQYISALDNAVIITADVHGFMLKVGDAGGNGLARGFTFIAMGV